MPLKLSSLSGYRQVVAVRKFRQQNTRSFQGVMVVANRGQRYGKNEISDMTGKREDGQQGYGFYGL